MSKKTPARKPHDPNTAKKQATRRCARHLSDLKREHGKPPADVPLRSNPIPRLISPVPSASWCTSPAQLCAELAE